MAKIFLKYIPQGPVKFQDHLRTIGVRLGFNDVAYDGQYIIGYLFGDEGEDVSRALTEITGRWSGSRLSEQEFLGGVINNWQPMKFKWVTSEDGSIQVEKTEEEKLDDFYKMIGEYLPSLPTKEEMLVASQAYKTHVMKEINKKLFYDNNDALADLAKSVMCITVLYPTLTPEQKALVDGYIEIWKNVYATDFAIEGFGDLTAQMVNILKDYYRAKVDVSSVALTDGESIWDIVKKVKDINYKG